MRILDKKNWVFEWTNEWSQLWGKYNWVSFTPIYVYFEKDVWIGGWEFHFTILGLGFYLRYNDEKAKATFEKWDKEIEDDKRNHPSVIA
jgi:hypothetical protein